MIDKEQIVEGARVRTPLASGTITSVDAEGIVTVLWDFGLSFAYAYDTEARRLEVYTTAARRTGGKR